jgi:hypothetical protein
VRKPGALRRQRRPPVPENGLLRLKHRTLS